MPAMPVEWSALCALVFVLGLKHGFDPDHLAAIDALTRYNQQRRRAFARYCGTLFSLGHGVVVIGVAIAVALARHRWLTPPWLEQAGAWTSILLLLLLASLNIRAVFMAPADQLVAPVGIKSRFLGQLTRAGRPLTVALVGATFAISFDTISQAALFALTAIEFGGLPRALALGGLFAAGMIVTDAVNGLWIARLIARADQIAMIASRVMSLAVAGISLLVASIGVASLKLPAVAQFSERLDLGAGAIVCALMILSYAAARRLARRRPAAAAGGL